MTTTAAPPPARRIAETSSPYTPDARVIAALHKYWGYDQLKPLQAEAIKAGLSQQDSLVVLPTGGGKSLCYQIPPIVAGRTDVVVSPLIALMKDQVDGLKANGYPAVAIYSGQSDTERRAVNAEIMSGKARLVFVAPERLLTPGFLSVIERLDVRAFAIDEAHCISQWGHDFRPEYRRLALLKQRFPKASMHAFTATATPRVRADIAKQLGLTNPAVLVGRFDRPNLVYRIVQRGNLNEQIAETVKAHAGEAVIVYCISRKDTEAVAEMLVKRGVKAAAYHAGLSPHERARTQELFAAERIDVVVATIAFGMGIDRSNVRCVIHAAMPKSIEHYQQETGRAGRDGLEAECVLIYSAADVRKWDFIMRKSAEEAEDQPPEVLSAQLALLDEMRRLCTSSMCRHAALTRYFGQEYESTDCKACDICLTEPGDDMEDSAEVSRQVVGCVAKLSMPFGVRHVVDILSGLKGERIEKFHHDRLPQHGALRGLPREVIQGTIFQLIDQGVLERTPGERPVLMTTARSGDVLSGRIDIKLRRPQTQKLSSGDDSGWEGVDRGLFEKLRELRRTIADAQGIPAFVVMSDASLRDLARFRPSTLEAVARIRGFGERKLAELGAKFLDTVVAYCKANAIAMDVVPVATYAPARVRKPSSIDTNAVKRRAFELFDRQQPVAAVAADTGRAQSTIAGYLEDYVGERKPKSIDPWVEPAMYAKIIAAAQQSGGSFLRPVFEALHEEVPYDEIRVAMRHAGLR